MHQWPAVVDFSLNWYLNPYTATMPVQMFTLFKCATVFTRSILRRWRPPIPRSFDSLVPSLATRCHPCDCSPHAEGHCSIWTSCNISWPLQLEPSSAGTIWLQLFICSFNWLKKELTWGGMGSRAALYKCSIAITPPLFAIWEFQS